MIYLLFILISLSLISCNLDSYVTPGEPVPPQSEVQAIPLPESGRPVPGSDYYFNSYSYIRVYDSGNRSDILTFGPDKGGEGEYLRYTILNTPDPGASSDGADASLDIDVFWGSYEILGSAIDLYSLYDYSFSAAPADNPYTDSLGVTVRRNTSPYKGQVPFTLSSDGGILTFDGNAYMRMDSYFENAMSAAQAAGSWNQDVLDFARLLYLNVLLSQAVIPGYGGLFRYTELVSNLVSSIINEEGGGDIIVSRYSSLYGDGEFRDSWTPPVDIDNEGNAVNLPSTTLLKMNNNHQVVSHMVVVESALNDMTRILGKDGTGQYWGSFAVDFTAPDGTVSNISVYLGSVVPGSTALDSYLVLQDSVVRNSFTGGLLASDPLQIFIDDNQLVAAAPGASDYFFLNPGNFTLPVTE
ncbi:MAG: hypothetical protein PQJ58_06195 [Spirochaetales bacterium]|nr:hypothetical protein [Spirochaetales bacterium]